MYNTHLEPFIVHADTPVYEAFWKLQNNRWPDSLGPYVALDALFVLDGEDKLYGVCTLMDFEKAKQADDPTRVTAREICTPGGKTCPHSEDWAEVCKQAAYTFSLYPATHTLPVVDGQGNVLDVITRKQVFYREFYMRRELPRMYYATCMQNAVTLAKQLGYPAISVIEFGVAGGNGLVCCEYHARELERLEGVRIELYGFDTGAGLPGDADPRNQPYLWMEGIYPMDEAKLRRRLTRSELILGDIRETGGDFFSKYTPAPIGAMLVDVDHYTSTVPVLALLKHAEKHFLPRMWAYFDDISPFNEGLGENLAVQEFNRAQGDVRISPEGGANKIKTIHRLRHPDYARPIDSGFPPSLFNLT